MEDMYQSTLHVFVSDKAQIKVFHFQQQQQQQQQVALFTWP